MPVTRASPGARAMRRREHEGAEPQSRKTPARLQNARELCLNVSMYLTDADAALAAACGHTGAAPVNDHPTEGRRSMTSRTSAEPEHVSPAAPPLGFLCRLMYLWW